MNERMIYSFRALIVVVVGLLVGGCTSESPEKTVPQESSAPAIESAETAKATAADNGQTNLETTAGTSEGNGREANDSIKAESEVSSVGPEAAAGESASTASPSNRSNWWYFRGDALGKGYVADSKLPDVLDVIWEYEGERTSFEGSPVVWGDRIVVGDLDGTLHCLNLSDGKAEWTKESKTMYIASPTLAEEGIYLGDGDGYMHLFDWDGKEQWQFETRAQIDSAANFFEDNLLFGSQDSVLYCVKRKDGTEVWTHQTDDQIRCSIVVANDRTYVAGCDMRLHLVKLENGEGLGEVPLANVTGSTPATWEDRVYFGLEDGQFTCIDVQKKETIWTWQHESGEAAIRGSASVDGERVIFGTRSSLVVCLKMSDGSKLWEYETDRKVDGSPVIVGNRVYIGEGSGKFLVLNRENGELIQELELSGVVLGSPCVVGNRLIVATDEGMVYCLGSQ